MNKGFLAGSTIYGTGAVGTTALSGLMLTGTAALLSNPVGWGILTGLGTVGGVVMAANSLQYLHGHQKQHRYDAYLERDDPELDREFLATLDIMAATSANSDKCLESRIQEQNQRGLEMRAHFYDQISRREDRRRNFLHKAANDMGKWQQRKIYSTDEGVPQGGLLSRIRRQGLTDETVVKKTVHRHSLAQRLNAATWQRGKAFTQGLFQNGDLKEAISKAQKAKSEKTDRFTSENLLEWLRQPQHFNDQVDFMLTTLKEQQEYLKDKVETKLRILEQTVVPEMQQNESDYQAETLNDTKQNVQNPKILTATTPELAAARATTEFLGRLDRGLERDQIMLAELSVLENEIENDLNAALLSTAAPLSTASSMLALVKERFMCLQTGYPFDPENRQVNIEATDKKFANFIKGGGVAEERHKHLRGMMVDLEMQATKIRVLSKQMTDMTHVLKPLKPRQD